MLGLALTTWLPAQDAPTPAAAAAPAVVPPAEVKDPAAAAKTKEQETLSSENKLEAERLVKATNTLRAEVTQLKLERELMTEKLALETAKRQASQQEQLAKLEAETEKVTEEGELSKVRAEKLGNDLKSVQTQAALDITSLQSEITRIEAAEKRAHFADFKPVFLQNPLKEDGVLVISDRRIPLNGPIMEETATFITSRIQYWNNKDRTQPIFIVIDSSPGGSVMAGYRILKAMESSDAPIHVVVKSFAASMAAVITTMAKHSYAYPNSVLLHHQVASTIIAHMNLTEQREQSEEINRWWLRLATPVAQKMGITTDEFIKKMYNRSSSGNWSEFGEQAKELKWVNNIVTGIDETSFNRDPDTIEPSKASVVAQIPESIDASGKPFAWLPRLNPKDVYFIHNSDGYYRVR